VRVVGNVCVRVRDRCMTGRGTLMMVVSSSSVGPWVPLLSSVGPWVTLSSSAVSWGALRERGGPWRPLWGDCGTAMAAANE
jgi:hypothetical protein